MLQLLSGIIIILVNSATMAAFLVAKEVRKKGNVLVASLALTDILVGLALCVESATWHPELFVLYRTDKASCLARSTWLATVKTYAVLIAALWVMAAVLGVVPVFVNQFDEYGVCDLAKFQPRGYVAIFAPAFYFICLLGASVLYLLVANLAWKKLRVEHNDSTAAGSLP
nr:hypothetical protein BaRGS_003449 [Batillaria attramentaria]